MPIANLHLDAHFTAGRDRIVDQADSIRDEARRIEFVAAASHDLARLGANLADVKPLAARDTQPATLSDGESMHSSMIGQPLAVAVDNRAGTKLRRSASRSTKRA